MHARLARPVPVRAKGLPGSSLPWPGFRPAGNCGAKGEQDRGKGQQFSWNVISSLLVGDNEEEHLLLSISALPDHYVDWGLPGSMSSSQSALKHQKNSFSFHQKGGEVRR